MQKETDVREAVRDVRCADSAGQVPVIALARFGFRLGVDTSQPNSVRKQRFGKDDSAIGSCAKTSDALCGQDRDDGAKIPRRASLLQLNGLSSIHPRWRSDRHSRFLPTVCQRFVDMVGYVVAKPSFSRR